MFLTIKTNNIMEKILQSIGAHYWEQWFQLWSIVLFVFAFACGNALQLYRYSGTYARALIRALMDSRIEVKDLKTRKRQLENEIVNLKRQLNAENENYN